MELPTDPASMPAFLTGGGRMAQEIANANWAGHPLGPIHQWPAALRTALSMMLNSHTPSYLVWGSEYYGFFNDAYIPQLGLKADGALGARFRDTWAEAWDVVGPIAERAFAGEGSHFEQMPIVVERSGFPERCYFTFSYSPVRDEHGDVVGVLCSTTDVTDLTRALKASRELEQRLQLSLDASGNIGTWSVDLASNMTYVDERFARLFHVDAEAARGGLDLSRFTSMIDARDRDRVLAKIAAAMASGELYEAEYRLPQSDRAEVWVMAKGRVFEDAVSGQRRFAGVAVDITERKRQEQSLKESEAKFRTIANAMPQMVWSTLPDGFHDYYNQQWYDFTGVPQGSTDGDAWNGLFHAEDQPRAMALWRACLASGAVYEIEYRLRHHSGHYRWVLGRALPVHDEQGEIIRWMGTCTDIHAHKAAQEELRKANQQKDEFLAMLAHELRNPLAPISTSAQLLGLPSVSAAAIKRASEVITRQVTHMTGLIDDLLDVSRVTRGLVTLADDLCELEPIVSSALEQTRPLVDSRGHQLVLHMPPGPVSVRGDRIRLVQVIANLVSNAAKYTPQRGRIEVALHADEEQVRIEVSDNGSGIEADLLPQVFDLFTQGYRTPDRAQGGLGLGLALVKHIVALHGGSVTAHSEGTGRGATFTVTLPRHAGSAPGAVAGTGSPASAKALRIMIVDDNVDAAQTLGALLESEGHAVSIYYEGSSALQAARRDVQDAFILDIGLPDMDGYELVRRIRALPGAAQARFIALTGYGQSHDRGLALAAGFDHHCVKPAQPDDMRRFLHG
ncbi:PAS domain S-box protein [Massilia sp. PAMC28688]|uniref:hybrid sensor histidine kinase/response regulator n=1 Tax=Massilia sp. PAMC28688 TaxID=2861283 RepID=UPI001C63194B|nr:PAS domain S-box protein [Massilia sp. PAMC28688]QYF92706.1 PAS domain S-box protein [Massilia sp. PAMC28688]